MRSTEIWRAQLVYGRAYARHNTVANAGLNETPCAGSFSEERTENDNLKRKRFAERAFRKTMQYLRASVIALHLTAQRLAIRYRQNLDVPFVRSIYILFCREPTDLTRRLTNV